MNKSKFFTVYDSKVGAYKPPFIMRNKGEATRGFETVVNDPSTEFYKYSGDFTLFEIGEYDDQTGMIIPYETKISLGTGNEFKKSVQ